MSRSAAIALYALLAAGLSPAVASAQLTKFNHIVFIVQENRTPDNMFHGLQKWLPAADIADSGLDSQSRRVALRPMTLAGTFDLGHEHKSFTADYDNGKMDGWDSENCQGNCPPHYPAYHFVRSADVQSYYDIARSYGFANRMFQTNQGPSFPAHQFIYSGTSQITADSEYFAADEPNGAPGKRVGCIAPPDQSVPVIGRNGREDRSVYPCFEHQALSDLLNKPRRDPTHPISWRYYTPSDGDIWTAPNAIEHICQAEGNTCQGPDWTEGRVVLWPPQVLLDIHFGRLAAVSWVIPTGQDSDHSYANSGTGPSWVASIVDAIGRSPYWDNTVIFITWDDWGGWYDHVPPPASSKFGYYEYGFRVPLLVVSPYTPKGYVSQQQHDFGSLLRFVEIRYDLGLIPPGDFADARADSLTDFFDFSRPPRPFAYIPTKVPESYFLDLRRPMLPPDND